MTSWKNITLEHLGAYATDEDLAEFRDLMTEPRSKLFGQCLAFIA